MKDLIIVWLWESEFYDLGESISGRWNSMHECLCESFLRGSTHSLEAIVARAEWRREQDIQILWRFGALVKESSFDSG